MQSLERIRDLLFQPRLKNVYLTDGGKWVFYWVAYYLADYLRREKGIRVMRVPNPLKLSLRNQIIHFGVRQHYLFGDYRSLHPSNKVFLTWFHGDPSDPHPTMRHLLDELPRAEPFLEKIVVSCSASRDILVNMGIPPTKIIMIRIGVDLKRFIPPDGLGRKRARMDLGIDDDMVLIGSFQKDGEGWNDGMEAKWSKAPELFLEVIERLSVRHHKLHVLLTGPARGFIKQGLDKIGVSYTHHILEHYHEIVRYYHALDYYLITSRCEGGPKGLMESWATGVPVVSTRVGMPGDLIQHEENGMLAESEDAIALTRHLEKLIHEKELRSRVRFKALDDVKPLNWPEIANQYYEELYAPCL